MNLLNRTISGVLLARLSAACLAVSVVAPSAMADEPPFVEDQALVRLVPGASLSGFLARYQTVVIDSIPSRSIYIIDVPEAFGGEEEFIDVLESDPEVRDAELNYLAFDTNPDPDTRSIFYRSTYLAYVAEPAMSVIGAPSPILSQGAGVIVAVIDSGVASTHSRLAGRIAPGGYNFIHNNTDTRDIGDGIDNNLNGDIDEMVGHGTLVAGLVARVAPKAKILPIRVLDSDGTAQTFDLVAGMYHAMDNGAKVMNISLSTEAEPNLIRDAVLEAESRGVLIVASAGNNNTESPMRYPASFSPLGVVSVAATDNADVKAEFSNYGPNVTISAPGVKVISLIPDGGYGGASGTSFSAPMVAGAAAVFRSARPGATNSQLRAMLGSHTDSLNAKNPGYEAKLGVGRLDLRKNFSPRGTVR